MDDLTPVDVLALYPAHKSTLPSLFESRSAIIPGNDALRFIDRTWSYSQLNYASTVLAHGLYIRGINKGDRVVVLAKNSDISILLLLAIAKLGAIYVPINPTLTNHELTYILEKCSPTLVVSCDSDIEKIKMITDSFQHSPWLLSMESIGVDLENVDNIIQAVENYSGNNDSIHLPHIAAEDPLLIIFTSGTTGLPKGVVHSHKNYVWAGEAFVERLHLQPSDKLLSIFPFYHINALFYSVCGAFCAGATMITTSKFSASKFWDLAVETGATQFNILAAVGSILGKRPRSEYNPNHKISKIYGGPINAEMFNLFQNEFHVETLIEGYGMSEIPGACNNPFMGECKVGSIGKPSVHPRFKNEFTKMRVEDDDGNELSSDETGELVVKTPILFLEYFDDPNETKSAFRNGWFKTGDLVRKDDDGYFYFIARKKDIIRCRGENISGAEVDSAVASHSGILEAATIGVPSELGEEDIMVVMVAKSSDKPKIDDLIDWCRGRLAPMKIPRYFVYVESLPHTPSERIEKYKLKKDPSLMAQAYDAQLKNWVSLATAK